MQSNENRAPLINDQAYQEQAKQGTYNQPQSPVMNMQSPTMVSAYQQPQPMYQQQPPQFYPLQGQQPGMSPIMQQPINIVVENNNTQNNDGGGIDVAVRNGLDHLAKFDSVVINFRQDGCLNRSFSYELTCGQTGQYIGEINERYTFGAMCDCRLLFCGGCGGCCQDQKFFALPFVWADIKIGQVNVGQLKGWNTHVYMTYIKSYGVISRMEQIGLRIGCLNRNVQREFYIYNHNDEPQFIIKQDCQCSTMFNLPCVCDTVEYEISTKDEIPFGKIIGQARFHLYYFASCWQYDQYKITFNPNMSGEDRLKLINAALFIDHKRRMVFTGIPSFYC